LHSLFTYFNNCIAAPFLVCYPKILKVKIYGTIILPVVLCGCEIWSLILREERRLRVFENRVLRRIFGPKREEVTGEWKKKVIMRSVVIWTPHPTLCR
jgi:hypothetical protein